MVTNADTDGLGPADTLGSGHSPGTTSLKMPPILNIKTQTRSIWLQ